MRKTEAVCLCICAEMFRPSMCEENILIEISRNEERHIMFFCDRSRRLTDVSTEYIRPADSLLVLSDVD